MGGLREIVGACALNQHTHTHTLKQRKQRTQLLRVRARLGVHLDVESQDAGVLLEALLDVGARLRHVLLEDGADAHLNLRVLCGVSSEGEGGGWGVRAVCVCGCVRERGGKREKRGTCKER